MSLRYVVTGGAGFIGSHLIEALLVQGHSVIAVDDLSTGTMDNLASVLDHPNFIRKPLRGRGIENEVTMSYAQNADVIVHLAAVIATKRILERPLETIETNILGTRSVLEAARQYGCRVIIASTAEVYGNNTKIPFVEDDELLLGPSTDPRWFYATGKLAVEHLALAYNRLERNPVPVVIGRLFNTIGPWQNHTYNAVVPTFIKQALCGEPLTVYGSGEQTRCFCDVRDVADAIIGLSLNPLASGQIVNIGSADETSIRHLAQLIKSLTNSSSPITCDHERSQTCLEIKRSVPDLTRVRTLLGWSPKYSLSDTLLWTIDQERHK